MPLNPSGDSQWQSASGGLPALPPPDRADGADRAQDHNAEPQEAKRASVAEWLGWSPTSWRARDTR